MKRLINISIIIMLFLGLMQSMTSTAIPAYSTLWEQLRSSGGTHSNTTNGIYAEDFTLTSAATIAQVELWNSMATPPASIQIDFYDNTNNLPGTLIRSEVITNAVTAFDGNGTPQQYRTTLTLTNPLSLDPGRYWVAIYSSDALFGWALGSPSSLPGSAWKFGDQAWDLITWQDLAFRIIGTWSGDLTAPVVSVPDNMTVPATSSSGVVVTYVATANDDVDGPITPICVPESGSIFALGTTTVDCTATDSAGNIGSASFTVTVSDLTAPVVSVPEDMTVPATSSSGAVVTFAATAVDEIDGTLVPTCVPASGSTFPIGATTVTCTATDTAGNIGSASFIVTVTSELLDILPYTLPSATVGFPYSQQLTAVGGTPPYSWSSIGLSGTPFSLITTGALMSGANPSTPGVIPFTAFWDDSVGVQFSKNLSLTVSPALTFDPETLPTGKVSEAYSQVITLSGGTAPYTITINSAGLPDWLTYVTDPSAGTITLSGTPTTVESFTVELQAADAVGVKGAKTYGLWIGPQRAFTWSPEFPNQGEGVTFTPLSEYNLQSISWWRGDTCDTNIPTYTNTAYVVFNDSGTYQICLKYYVSSISAYAWDKQWVTVAVHTPTTLHVNAADDIVDGACNTTHCSLREAVLYSGPGDTIDFTLTSLPETITLINGQILIDKDLTIVGPGAELLAISGGAELNDAEPWLHDRVFSIRTSSGTPVNVSISGLTIRDGRANGGGGILVDWGGNTLNMEDCVIGPNNIVTYAGGGITNYGGDVTLNRCTVTENEGTGSLGGAGVTTAYGATTTLINSTVSGNITNNYGGGIYVCDALVRLIHTTVSGNIANENYMDEGEERGGGAGIYIDCKGQVELQNSIVAGNTDMTDPVTAGHEKWHDVYGPAISLGGNLIGISVGSTNPWAASDLVGTAESPLDPLLGALSVNDPGTTSTMALLTGSPAIDAADCLAEVTIDQRGITRPQGSACDIGAYELEAPVTGSLKISKVFDPLTSGYTGTFAIDYDCDDGEAHDGTVNLAAGASQTITGIPIGTQCTVTEPILPTGPTGWSFSSPTFSPETGTVTISEAISGVIVTNTINQAFSKLLPADGAVDQPLAPTLTWETSAGASSYEYCLGSTAGNCDIVDWTNVDGDTSKALTGLAASITYYWQVRAINPGGVTGADSDTWWSFDTVSDKEDPYFVFLPLILH